MRLQAARSPILAVMLLVGAALGSADGQASFDGSWSVLVVTESGNCDRAYRYDVQVKGGRLQYAGTAGIDLAGRVSSAGQVQVTIGRGEQSASGTGRLSRNAGAGTWKGRSPQRQCSGRWEAERRG